MQQQELDGQGSGGDPAKAVRVGFVKKKPPRERGRTATDMRRGRAFPAEGTVRLTRSPVRCRDYGCQDFC